MLIALVTNVLVGWFYELEESESPINLAQDFWAGEGTAKTWN